MHFPQANDRIESDIVFTTVRFVLESKIYHLTVERQKIVRLMDLFGSRVDRLVLVEFEERCGSCIRGDRFDGFIVKEEMLSNKSEVDLSVYGQSLRR